MLLKLPEKASKSSDMKALVPKTAVAEDTAERPSFAYHENPTPSAPRTPPSRSRWLFLPSRCGEGFNLRK